MKKIFTLCFIGAIWLFNGNASAQTINEHFENDSAILAADCWQFISMKFANSTGPTSGFVINGNGSLYSEPPVSQDSIRIMRTPLLNVGNSISISFSYKLSAKLSGQQTRTTDIDLVDNNGILVQSLATLFMDQNTNNTTSTTLFSQTFSVNAAANYRLALVMSGSTGGGNVRLSVDDFTENAPVIGCFANSTLPAKLISFQGNLNNNKVNLQWAVAQNEDDNRFEVEKSNDGEVFNTAALVMTSSKYGAESYSFSEAMNPEKIYYRLKMVDKNQEIAYSKILVFENKNAANGNTLKIINNPATDKLTLSFSSANNQSIEFKVYDMSGRVQMDQKMNVYQGSNLVSVPLCAVFNTGMYAVEIINGSERQTAKFIKQ